MAKKKWDEEDGVWRTIGGRRVFIRKGQSMADAMKNSGKFKIKAKESEAKEMTSTSELKSKLDQSYTKQGDDTFKKATPEKKSNELSESDRKKKIEELEKKKEETQGFLQKGAIQEEIDMLKDNFTGTKEEYREHLSKEREKRLQDYEKEREERRKLSEQQNGGQEDYKMAHRPTETGITADDLLKKGNEVEMPKDMYEHPEYYSMGDKKSLNETMKQLNQARNNPEAEITIYRATTGNSINDGDWITLSKDYANMHNESQLDGKGKVLEMKVKAKDIQYAGDSLEEWGYFPKEKNVGNNDFSKSKIKNTLYHGTDEDFEEFSLDKFGKHDQGDFGKGIYFTDSKETARKYGKNIKEVNVNIEKPYEINSKEDYKKMWHEIAQNVDKSKLSDVDLELYNDPYTPQEDKDFMLYDTLSAENKMNTFKKMGYDGIIDNTYHQVVVFDKEQIKNKEPENKNSSYWKEYEKYKKEHKDSNISFLEFKKKNYK